MRRLSLTAKAIIILTALAVLLLVGAVIAPQLGSGTPAANIKKSPNSNAASQALRKAVDLTVARLGQTGWTEVNHQAKTVTVFDPSSKLEFQIAQYVTKPPQKAEVLGSAMIAPFRLMELLEEDSDSYAFYATEKGYGMKFKDTLNNGTSATEYEVEDGVLRSLSVRDRIGQENELNARTDFYYGLDKEGKKALSWANSHISRGGHD